MGTRASDEATIDLSVLTDVFDEFPVSFVVLYGSHARGSATADSDLDLAIAFSNHAQQIDRTQARFGLIDRLSGRSDREVDVVPLSEVPPSLREVICAEGTVIYGDPEEFTEFCDREPTSTSEKDRSSDLDEVIESIERLV